MLEIDRRLRAWGCETSIFAQHIAQGMAHQARPDYEYAAYLPARDALLIYHYGLYTPSVRYYQATQGRRILIYHNITPGHYFRGWSRDQELLCDIGRRTLPSLVGGDLALGDSGFNRQELVEAGFPRAQTDVLPIFVSQPAIEGLPTDSTLLDRLRDKGEANFLTVGRVVPNKAIEDVIRIFAVYHRAIDPGSRLYIVGSRYLARYDAALDALVAELDLERAVVFTGLVSDVELATYYQAADLYLHASHHEGFCVPLVEAMHFGVPILARRAAAVPETLGTAGVLFTRLGYQEVAEMAHLLLADSELRSQVVVRQRERMAAFSPRRVEAKLHAILASMGILSDVEDPAHA
jgi:glycosyltransferase involved in cell wall biosynthesis